MFSSVFAILLASTPTATVCDAASLAHAVADYAAATRRMDIPALAASFLPDGTLSQRGGASFTGPAAIAAFLQGFAAYKVLSDEMTVERGIEEAPGVWRASGVFRQQVKVPAGDTVTASGHFEGVWIFGAAGAWRIRSLETW